MNTDSRFHHAPGPKDPRRPLVIGYGNPQRQDDGLGWHIAHALQALVASQSIGPLHVVASQQLQPELSVAIAASRAVLFVDAAWQQAVGSAAPLAIQPIGGDWRSVARAGEGPRSQPLSHQLTPQALMALSALLAGRHPPGWALPIPGQWFGFGDQLSPRAQQAITEAVALIRQWAQGPFPDA